MQAILVTISPGCYNHHMAREEFGVRLRRMREQRELSIREFARRAGVDHSNIVLLEQGKRWRGKLPPYDDLLRYARTLGTTVDDLIGPQNEVAGEVAEARELKEPLAVVLARIGAFPLDEEPPIPLDQPVAAGQRGAGIVQGSDDLARRRRRRHEPRRYLVRIDGDCLEPRASRGDYAVFDPEQPAEHGDLVVIAHGDQALVKYLAAQDQDAVQWLMPLVGEPIQLVPEMRIVGVVTEIRRGPGRSPGVPKRRG